MAGAGTVCVASVAMGYCSGAGTLCGGRHSALPGVSYLYLYYMGMKGEM